jgi:predicted TIM-barrel fold metal-dependent hydrolase
MPDDPDSPSTAPLRFLDTHVHFWDPARPDWYPHLAPDADLSAINLGKAEHMKRHYDHATYQADATGIDIVGIVHVTATRGAGNYLGETAELGRLHAQVGLPAAIVGGFNPDAALVDIAAELDEQAQVPLFHGIRTTTPIDYTAPKAADMLRLFAERGLVYDVVTHPAAMAAVAHRLEASPDATYVIEHTGWPLFEDDGAHTAQWREGMRMLAAAGPHVHCKLSGLPMTLHRFDVAALRPWLEHALEVFGADRCLFGSNFPVDAMFGDLPSLLRSYQAITEPLGRAAQAKLFVDNARAIYLRG